MYGKELSSYHGQYEHTELSEQGLVTTKMHKFITDTLKDDIAFQNEKRRLNYDKRQTKPSLKKRDSVYLSIRNFREKYKKLNYKNIESFEVLKERKEDTYKLKLSDKMKRIHSIFHISLLEPASKDVRLATDDDEESDEEQDNESEYEIEKILESVYIEEQLHYLIH